MRAVRSFVFAAAMAVAALSLSPAPADDQDRAREAVAAGRILPLSAIVERAVTKFGGTVLDVDYEDDDEEDGSDRERSRRSRYEVKLLTADGRILKLDYDAATGELVGQRGRQREGRGHDGDR